VDAVAQQSESRSLDKVIVRLPDGMRDRIREAAEANNRSMNAEIVAALEKEFPAPALHDVLDIWAIEMDYLDQPDDEARKRFLVSTNRRLADRKLAFRYEPSVLDGKQRVQLVPISRTK